MIECKKCRISQWETGLLMEGLMDRINQLEKTSMKGRDQWMVDRTLFALRISQWKACKIDQWEACIMVQWETCIIAQWAVCRIELEDFPPWSSQLQEDD